MTTNVIKSFKHKSFEKVLVKEMLSEIKIHFTLRFNEIYRKNILEKGLINFRLACE